jgi:phage terminase large subunit-like protein
LLVTLGRSAMVDRIPYARKQRQLPVILSADEVVRFLAAVPNLKHRTALMTAYAAGLRIVAEVNNGGDMVEATIRMVDPNVSYNKVHASRGKVIRAEPVAALYEQGRIHHVGAFPTLEDQQCAFTTDFDRKAAGNARRPPTRCRTRLRHRAASLSLLK